MSTDSSCDWNSICFLLCIRCGLTIMLSVVQDCRHPPLVTAMELNTCNCAYNPVAEFLLTKSCVYILQIATGGNTTSPFSEFHLRKSALNLYFHVFPWDKIIWLLFLGHEGDPCLRSSDCIEGHCCARHFWTKICKPVLHQGEVCTKQRKKGSHGLEIFQRCDCAKGLSCKVWKDATSSSKSRLHVCQKIWTRIGKVVQVTVALCV